jgi:hypothetical protein
MWKKWGETKINAFQQRIRNICRVLSYNDFNRIIIDTLISGEVN